MATQPLKTEREICAESAAQDARTKQWQGWTWRDYQAAIVRLNHHVSNLEAIASKARSAELQAAIDEAKAALVGDSNDAEHDALVSLIKALGEGEVPECDCDERSWRGDHHDTACPASAWQGGGR